MQGRRRPCVLAHWRNCEEALGSDPLIALQAERELASIAPVDAADAPGEPYAALLLPRLTAHARCVLAADRACVLLADAEWPGTAVVAEAQGLGDDLTGRRVPLAAGLEAALSSAAPLLAPADALFEPLGRGSGGAIRIAGPPGAEGVLCIASRQRRRRFDRCDHALLVELATLFAAALEDLRMGRALGRKIGACSGELTRLAAASGCGGLAELVRGIGAAIGLEPAALTELELAALLSELRGGAAAGCEVALMPGFEAVGLILRLAEELRDGDGHPHGLTRDRIPVASRILASCRVAPSTCAAGPQGEMLGAEAGCPDSHQPSGWHWPSRSRAPRMRRRSP